MGIFGDWLGKLAKTNVGDEGNIGPGRTPSRLGRVVEGDRRARTPRAPQHADEDLTPTFDVDPPEEEPLDISSPENSFLGGEVVYTPFSSNVYALQYINAEQILVIGYGGKTDKPGITWYGYRPISPDHAIAFTHAGSVGGKVWDDLRVRGTVFGHKVEYFLMDGPSTHVPAWHRAGDESITAHGAVGRAGEPFKGWTPQLQAAWQQQNRASSKGGMGRKGGASKPWQK
jgi:hypothetical protein